MDTLECARVGQFIAELRKEREMTQQELAAALHITDKAVSKWETGRGFPDIQMLNPLADILGVSIVELLNGKRIPSENVSKRAADDAACCAVRHISGHIFRRLQHMLYFIAGVLSCILILFAVYVIWPLLLRNGMGTEAVIGGVDSPTGIHIVQNGPNLLNFLFPLVFVLLIVLCLIVAGYFGRKAG